jgi:hypothetical protein
MPSLATPHWRRRGGGILEIFIGSPKICALEGGGNLRVGKGKYSAYVYILIHFQLEFRISI